MNVNYKDTVSYRGCSTGLTGFAFVGLLRGSYWRGVSPIFYLHKNILN